MQGSAAGRRPWTFYALAAFFALFVLFLYGPMMVIYILSFQGPNGGLTFPMTGFSTRWFGELVTPGRSGDIPGAFTRSILLAAVVAVLTVLFCVSAGLGFRRRFPGSGALFYLAIASLVMPGLFVGLGISLGFQLLGLQTDWAISGLGAQLTWTLPFGLLVMFAVIGRFNRSSYDEFARTVLTAGATNTLPMEIWAMTTNVTSPALFAVGTVTTIVSFVIIGTALGSIALIQRRRTRNAG